MKNKIIPYLVLVIGITALAFSAMFVRWSTAPGAITGFYRLLISTLLFIPFLWRQSRRLPSLSLRHLLLPILAGSFTAIDFALWNTSVKYTTAANAALLGNTSPVWVALFALVFLHEKLHWRFWMGLFATLVGAALVIGINFYAHFHFGLGDLMASCSAIFYALYQLITQRGRQHIDAFRFMAWVGISATLGMGLINLLLGNAFTGYPSQTWLIFLVTAVVSQMVGYFSITYALGHLPASLVSPSLIGSPLLTALLAIPLLGEIPTAYQGLGILLAIVGIYIVNQSHLHFQEEIPNA